MLPEELMREVRLLELRARRRVNDLFTGEYHSAFRGQGMEFAEVREYEPGDDIRAIDWNVTARSGKPYIKRFVEERENSVVLAVDLSASSGFGSRTRTKARLSAEVCAILAMVAQRNNDKVGLARFADDFDLFLPPSKGRDHLLRIIREVLDEEPAGSGTALTETLVSLERLLRRRAVLFVVSDFLVPLDDAFSTVLRALGRRHDLTLLRVTDPAERELPKLGLLRAIDPESGRAVVFDAGSRRTRKNLAARATEHEQKLLQIARSAKADLVDLATPGRYVDDLAAAFRRREGRR